ncbi:MAG: hypothetical protein MUE75_10715 [Algoriphagus sp.]|nr:hypothetical protein [Algoriphagus sp.]
MIIRGEAYFLILDLIEARGLQLHETNEGFGIYSDLKSRDEASELLSIAIEITEQVKHSYYFSSNFIL